VGSVGTSVRSTVGRGWRLGTELEGPRVVAAYISLRAWRCCGGDTEEASAGDGGETLSAVGERLDEEAAEPASSGEGARASGDTRSAPTRAPSSGGGTTEGSGGPGGLGWEPRRPALRRGRRANW